MLKKYFKSLFYLVLILTISISVTDVSYAKGVNANYNNSKLILNDNNLDLEAYNIKGNNYFKLRDLASVFSKTNKPFDVQWNNHKKLVEITPDKVYTTNNNDFQKSNSNSKIVAKQTKSKILFNGKEIDIQAYNINGSNYFKLRDICENLNISVEYDNNTKQISLNTNKPYVKEVKPNNKNNNLDKYKKIIESGKLGKNTYTKLLDIIEIDLDHSGNKKIAAIVTNNQKEPQYQLLFLDKSGKLLSNEFIYLDSDEFELAIIRENYEGYDDFLAILEEKEHGTYIYTFELYENKLKEFPWGQSSLDVDFEYMDNFKLKISSCTETKVFDLSDKKDLLINSGIFSENGEFLIEDDSYTYAIHNLHIYDIDKLEFFKDSKTGYTGILTHINLYDKETMEPIFSFKVLKISGNEDLGFKSRDIL